MTGIFGPNTRTATIAFQRRVGLNPDGVIGCNTWRELTTRGIGIGRSRTTID
ncbi:MAG: peptidoglycan-binding protein [Oscillospiraceae bacterium]|nr:peptidoglycan-binding protein [Oscillospiraceae bacterium]